MDGDRPSRPSTASRCSARAITTMATATAAGHDEPGDPEPGRRRHHAVGQQDGDHRQANGLPECREPPVDREESIGDR